MFQNGISNSGRGDTREMGGNIYTTYCHLKILSVIQGITTGKHAEVPHFYHQSSGYAKARVLSRVNYGKKN